MSLQSAILALSPIHYWTFGTTSGQLSVADTVGTLNFSSAVNDGGGLTGPEVGTTAQRIFSDQIWTTAALGASAWTNSTWLMMFSAPNTGAVTTYQDVLGWGDPSNRTARGFRVQLLSSTLNTGGFHLQGVSSVAGTAALAYPQNGWHLLWWTIQPSPAQIAITFDGATPTVTANTPGLAPQTTDQLWIQSANPIAIAHLAAFNVVLNPTQIGTITSQIVNWPTQIPINIPIQGGVSGPVTIEPTDPTIGQIITNQQTFMPQITDIHTEIPALSSVIGPIPVGGIQVAPAVNQTLTDTHNIVNSLFPQLSDFLNTIMGAVTGVITGVGGAVSKTVGDILSGRTFDLLTEQDFGTVCGGSTLSQELGGGYFFAIKVILTSYADWYVWTGPGETYSTQSLGTLEIFRGDALVVRIGLHTHTHEVYPLPGISSAPIISEIAIPIPLTYDVVLVPAPETCWQLIGIKLP